MNAWHKQSIYSDPSPYPEIEITQQNSFYAELLMDDYAGFVSEVTAINQYLFHHVMFEPEYEDLAKLLEGVSITEMHHMDMLAGAIKKLGGVPILRGSYSTWNNYWNGGFVFYGNTLCDRLNADIQSEKQAIANYREHIRLINDLGIKKMLERIILDEEVHLRLFTEALEKYNCK